MELPTLKLLVLCKLIGELADDVPSQLWGPLVKELCWTTCVLSDPVRDSVRKFLFSDLLFKIATASWRDLLKGWHNKALYSTRALCYLYWRQDVSKEQPWGLVFKDVVSRERGRDRASWKISHFVAIQECAFFANWEYVCRLLCCYVMSVAYIFWHLG